MAAIELVLFDFGGTLFMPAPTRRLLHAAAAGLGLELDDDALSALAAAYDAAGIPGGPVPPIPAELQAAYDARDLSTSEHRHAWLSLLNRAEIPTGLSVGDPAALAAAVYDQTRRADQWLPYPDAAPTLHALAERELAVGVISNIGFDLREIFHSHGFGALAETITQSYEVGVMKPHPEIFTAALERFGVPASAALMVGDSREADGGAAALGMTTLILEMTPPGTHHGLGRVVELVDELARP